MATNWELLSESFTGFQHLPLSRRSVCVMNDEGHHPALVDGSTIDSVELEGLNIVLRMRSGKIISTKLTTQAEQKVLLERILEAMNYAKLVDAGFDPHSSSSEKLSVPQRST